MDLFLVRDTFTKKSTTGPLYLQSMVDEKLSLKRLCYILEDVCRQEFGKPWTSDLKIPKQTAIPYGTFEVIYNMSPSKHIMLPRLVNVPDFVGVLIHSGNDAEDSDACLLTGTTRSKDYVFESKKALNEVVIPLVKKTVESGERIWLHIIKG